MIKPGDTVTITWSAWLSYGNTETRLPSTGVLESFDLASDKFIVRFDKKYKYVTDNYGCFTFSSDQIELKMTGINAEAWAYCREQLGR